MGNLSVKSSSHSGSLYVWKVAWRFVWVTFLSREEVIVAFNRLGGVMVSMLAWRTKGFGFDPQPGQTKDIKIGICRVRENRRSYRSRPLKMGSVRYFYCFRRSRWPVKSGSWDFKVFGSFWSVYIYFAHGDWFPILSYHYRLIYSYRLPVNSEIRISCFAFSPIQI